MKRIIITITSLLICTNLYAEENNTFAIKTSPIFSLLEIEYKLTDNFSIAVNAASENPAVVTAFIFDNSLNSPYNRITTKSSVGLRLNWIPNGAFKKGSYFSAFTDKVSLQHDDYFFGKATATTGLAGVKLGYQWIWMEHIMLTTGGGAAYIKGSTFNRAPSLPPLTTKGTLAFTVDFLVSYTF